jgi:hypothetical protein
VTAERVRAQQQPARPTGALRMVACTVASVTPLTVTLPGGAVVAARKVKGLTYTVGDSATVLIQEPNVGFVIPLG